MSSSNDTPNNVITIIQRGDIEAVVYIEETHTDRYRYPSYRIQRACFSKAGKPIAARNNFFDYNVEDIVAAIKEAAAICRRYQQNPKKTIEDFAVHRSQLELPKQTSINQNGATA